MALGELKHKALEYGDDLFATVVEERAPHKNERGIMMKKYLIVPHQDLIDAYPEIFKKPDILNIRTPLGLAMWVEYPVFWITDENPSRRNSIARIDCGFDGRETPYTERHAKLTAEIARLKIDNETLRINKVVDDEEKRELLGDKLEFEERMAEINQIRQGGRYVKEEEREEGEESQTG